MAGKAQCPGCQGCETAGPMVFTEEAARDMNAGVRLAVSSYTVQDPSL